MCNLLPQRNHWPSKKGIFSKFSQSYANNSSYFLKFLNNLVAFFTLSHVLFFATAHKHDGWFTVSRDQHSLPQWRNFMSRMAATGGRQQAGRQRPRATYNVPYRTLPCLHCFACASDTRICQGIKNKRSNKNSSRTRQLITFSVSSDQFFFKKVAVIFFSRTVWGQVDQQFVRKGSRDSWSFFFLRKAENC